jgi:hypothetical protein
VRNELVAAGAADPHHVLPESGWISFYIRQPEQMTQALALLRRSYELAMRQQEARLTLPLTEENALNQETTHETD